MVRLCCALLLLPAAGAAADVRLQIGDKDTVVIHAAEAWEGDSANTFHLRGGVEIRAPDWSVVADAATLEGSIDNPNKVIVEGSPARIRIILKNRDDDLEGKSTRIEYDRARDTLSLAGGAQLDESGQSVTSGTIEYKLGSRVFRTAGGERVRIVLDPKKSR